MKIYNKRITIIWPSHLSVIESEELQRFAEHPEVLRWAIVLRTKDEVTIEATICEDLPRWDVPEVPYYGEGTEGIVSLIPTGIGCSIGGFSGDAGPVTKLLSSAATYLITNPNSVNASHYISLSQNTVYTEGSIIDGFLEGRFPLWIPERNRIGVVIEPTSRRNEELLLNVINGVRAVHGIDVVDIEIARASFGTRIERTSSGAFVGTISNPEAIIDAATSLKRKGATAIALTSQFQNLPQEDYYEHFKGNSPNPVGGAEAIISHLVVRTLNIPAARGPLLNFYGQAENSLLSDARGAAEVASQTGLGCVLIGLHQAPQIIKPDLSRGMIGSANVRAVLCPATAFGGAGVIAASRRGIRCIAVNDNKTILNVLPGPLGMKNVLSVRSYMEARGALAAIQSGISIESLQRPLRTMTAIGSNQVTIERGIEKVAIGIN